MELFVLDSQFRRTGVIDDYDSLIWTERYNLAGDIILKMVDNAKNRLAYPEGTFVALSVSKEVMILETRSIEKGSIEFRGSSLVAFLRNRLIKKSWDNKYGTINFEFLPGLIPGLLVTNYATTASADPNVVVPTGDLEMIPNLTIGPADTSYTDEVAYSVQNGNLYDAQKAACDTFGFGFSLYLADSSDTSYSLVYLSYKGLDRTSKQTANAVVQFSPAVDSLVDIKELRSIAGYKNVAYAFATNVLTTTAYIGYAYANSDAISATGFDRRTLLVLADDIQPDDVNLTTSGGRAAFLRTLNTRAKNGLINNNYVKMVDGQIVPQSAYKYGADYNLGDTIDLLAAGGSEHSTAMVTEYIYTKDTNGFASYPTLSVL